MAKLKKYEWFAVIKNDGICVSENGTALMTKTKVKLVDFCDTMEQIENIIKIDISSWRWA